MTPRLVALCSLALTLAACDADESRNKSKGPPADLCKASSRHVDLEIGTSYRDGASVASFLPVEEDDALELVHGPQGGFHVEIALRGSHLDTSELLPGEIRGWVNGELLANVAPWFLFNCTDEGQDSWGTLMIFRAQPEDLHLQTVDVEVDLVDVSGNEVSMTSSFLISDPEFL